MSQLSPSPNIGRPYLSEVIMRNISKERFLATRLRMAFEDGLVSFYIPECTTLVRISENLNKVGKRHDKLVSIDVRFQAPDQSHRL